MFIQAVWLKDANWKIFEGFCGFLWYLLAGKCCRLSRIAYISSVSSHPGVNGYSLGNPNSLFFKINLSTYRYISHKELCAEFHRDKQTNSFHFERKKYQRGATSWQWANEDVLLYKIASSHLAKGSTISHKRDYNGTCMVSERPVVNVQ